MEQQIAFFNNVNDIIYLYPLHQKNVFQTNYVKDFHYDLLNNDKIIIKMMYNEDKENLIENKITYNRFQVNKNKNF